MEGRNEEDPSSETLASQERMVSESPVMWPDQPFCKHVKTYPTNYHIKNHDCFCLSNNKLNIGKFFGVKIKTVDQYTR